MNIPEWKDVFREIYMNICPQTGRRRNFEGHVEVPFGIHGHRRGQKTIKRAIRLCTHKHMKIIQIVKWRINQP